MSLYLKCFLVCHGHGHMCKSLFPSLWGPNSKSLSVELDLNLSTHKHFALLQQVLYPLQLIVHTDASKIQQDSSSTLPLRKKSPQHIAVVSQDEWMTLAADVGVLLFRLGIRLPSLARLWPLGESPVLIRGMLWLTCLVTPALTPAAALHSVLGVCVSSRCNCSCVSHHRPVSVCKYACSVQCMFLHVSSEVVLTPDTCCLMIKERVRHWWSLIGNPKKSDADLTD